MAFRRPDRATLLLAAVFAIPPAVGMALATLRVTDGDAWMLAATVATVVSILVAGFVLLIASGGEANAAAVHDR